MDNNFLSLRLLNSHRIVDLVGKTTGFENLRNVRGRQDIDLCNFVLSICHPSGSWIVVFGVKIHRHWLPGAHAFRAFNELNPRSASLHCLVHRSSLMQARSGTMELISSKTCQIELLNIESRVDQNISKPHTVDLWQCLTRSYGTKCNFLFPAVSFTRHQGPEQSWMYTFSGENLCIGSSPSTIRKEEHKSSSW